MFTDMLSKLMTYFTYPFVRYAFIVGVLIALCSSLLGVPLVLKRYSYIGDGLSHVAFGAVSVATVMNMTGTVLLSAPVTVLCAVLLLRRGRRSNIKGDAAIAMVSVGSLAAGYLLMNRFGTSANLSGDVCTTLFGATSILTLQPIDVYMCIALSLVVLLLFVFYYHRIFLITFDEEFAQSVGIAVNSYNLLLAVITALVIVLAMNLVGSLLISALIIFPAVSAMRLFKSFLGVSICSGILGVVHSTLGLLVSILAGTPAGSTIVVVHLLGFLLCSVAGWVLRECVS